MEQSVNEITLCGSLHTLPEFSHENHGNRFFRFLLDVPRLSGTLDVLPVIVHEEILNQVDLSGGEMLRLTGQVRSRNVRTDGVRHLKIFVFAQTLQTADGPAVNEVTLEGSLCREPTYRTTPLGREICDVMLAVPQTFHRANYLPCIFWGSTALAVSLCHTTDRVRVFGRLQSRIYTKLTPEGPVERTAYEISALKAELPEGS